MYIQVVFQWMSFLISRLPFNSLYRGYFDYYKNNFTWHVNESRLIYLISSYAYCLSIVLRPTHSIHVHRWKRTRSQNERMIPLNKEKHPLLIQWIIKNLSWFFMVLKQGWCIICVFLISVYSMDRYFGVIIEVWLMILYTLGPKQWISFWCVTLSFHWIKMNRMGGPSYNRRYVHEWIK